MRWLVALAIACGAPPVTHVPPRELPIPGLRWVTPAQPYRVDGALAIGVDGDRAVVFTTRAVAELDLATGAVGEPHPLPHFFARDVVRIDAKRWLALGYVDRQLVAATIDVATLAVTPISFAHVSGATPEYPHAAVLADGSVLITGTGLPLATYDPVTWQVRRTLDPTPSWADTAVDGNLVYARQLGKTVRFDLATGQQKELADVGGIGIDAVVAGGGIVAKITLRRDVTIVAHDALVATVDKDVDAIAIDAAGKRLATLARGVLRIHALPSGKLLASFTLGPGLASVPVHLVFAGERVVAVGLGAVRVVDLAAGTSTPAGLPPFGPAGELAVRGDGAVLDVGDQAWRLVDGRVTATAPSTGTPLALPAGELRQFADLDSDNETVTLHALDDATPVRTWKVGPASSGWLGDTGEVAIAGDWDGSVAARLIRSAGTDVVPVVMYARDTSVVDVDVDGGTALIAIDGVAKIVTLGDGVVGATLRGAGCTVDDGAVQRGGSHVAIIGGDQVLVYARTGEPVASLATGVAPARVKFVPHRSEVAFDTGAGLVLWDYARGEVRELTLAPTFSTALSPDGRVVAFAFTDGRVAVADLAALRAALPVTRAKAGTVPDHCDARDPLDIPPDEQAHPDSDQPPPEEGWIPDPE